MKIVEGVIEVESVEDVLDVVGSCSVLINAEYVLNVETVMFAVQKALKSWKEGRNVAKSLQMEILLYVSATRQIRDAVRLGIKEGKNEVVAVLLEDRCLEKLREIGFIERRVLKMNEEKVKKIKEFYRIGDEELKIVGVEKLPLLVREKIALFDVFKW
jgi:KEOPS complex subunit Cgi121